MRMTSEQYREYVTRKFFKERNHRPAVDPAKPEKHKAHRQRKSVDRSKGQSVDGIRKPAYSVTIEVEFPNNRRIDLDGIANTVCDLIQLARRRLLDANPRLEDYREAVTGRTAANPHHD